MSVTVSPVVVCNVRARNVSRGGPGVFPFLECGVLVSWTALSRFQDVSLFVCRPPSSSRAPALPVRRRGFRGGDRLTPALRVCWGLRRSDQELLFPINTIASLNGGSRQRNHSTKTPVFNK